MKFRNLFTSVVCLAFIMASSTPAQSKRPRALSSNASRKVKLKCSPQTVFRGDTLTLEMATPHGGDLAVRSPDGTDFLVVYKPQEAQARSRSLMDPEEFMKLAQLNLITDKTKARPWVYGRNKDELIFTRTGWYAVRLSENLLSDDGTPVYQCKVYYSHRRRH
jgi:hypothetical protein